MAAIEWIRFLVGAFFLLCGLAIFVVEMIGVFRFRYVLNRMHAAAMGDTLGIGLSLVGLIIMSGFTFTSLKLFLVIVFLWFSSPASSHLIARLEVTTDEEPEKHYRRVALRDLERELQERAAAGDEPDTQAADGQSGTDESGAQAVNGHPGTDAPDARTENESDADKPDAQTVEGVRSVGAADGKGEA